MGSFLPVDMVENNNQTINGMGTLGKSEPEIVQKNEIALACKHDPKTWRLKYRCIESGNYILELCDLCKNSESKEFLIEELRL